MSTRLAVAIVVVVHATACGGDSSRAIDSSTACSSDQQCSGSTPACDTQAMVCVQCTELNASACTGATPFCGGDHACRSSCNADADCLSGVCLGDNSCADAGRVLWVARDVTGTTCTPMDKCQFLTALNLVTSAKDIIHLDPLGYQFTTGFMITKKVLVVGRGATVAVNQAPVFQIQGAGDLTLDAFSITGSPGNGLDCTNGKLALRAQTLAGAKGLGISSSGCTLGVDRSSLHDNTQGAMQLGGGGTFKITNTFVFRNGNATDASVGGIQVLGSATGSQLEFDTIVDNVASAGATNAGGIACNTTFAAPNNIIARNAVGVSTAAANAQTLGTCAYPTSAIQNDVAGFAFVSPDVAPFNYKLGTGSKAIDAATTSSTVNVDNDGDSRPQGAQKDQGADEKTP
jgi:hypothetical protein